MINVTNHFDNLISNAIFGWEQDHSEEVRYAVGMDFLPDTTSETEVDFKLLPAVGIYLEIAGPSPDQVITNSFYHIPYLVDEAEVKSNVVKQLDDMLARREAAQAELRDSLLDVVKVEQNSKRSRS